MIKTFISFKPVRMSIFNYLDLTDVSAIDIADKSELPTFLFGEVLRLK